MKRIVALLLLIFLLAGCGAVAEEIPLTPIDPAPSMGDTTNPTDGGEETTPLPVHVHEFSEPTCTEAKTCVCGETEGEAKGHSWNDATCTVPKTCGVCGETEGESNGHNWQDATCAAPKTCKDCGLTEGNTAEHNWQNATCTKPKTCQDCGKAEGVMAEHVYQNGKCTACGALDPEPPTGEMVWIPNSGKKYHASASCSGMKNPTEVTKEEAIQRNFTPCKKCYK